MKYDLFHLPGVVPPGCGEQYVSREIPPGHDKGDRINIKCGRCGKYGEHEVMGALRGLA